MYKHPDITESRIRKAIGVIESLIYTPKQTVQLDAWHVGGEPVPYKQAVKATYKPFKVGSMWGPSWDTSWFRVRGKVPKDWAGKKVFVLMRLTDQGREGFTAEGLIYSNGVPVRALNANRNDIEVLAKPGENFEYYVEAASNFADCAGLSVNPGPGPIFKLVQAELACFNPEAFGFYYDFKVAAEAMFALPATSQRRAELRTALNESVNLFDVGDEKTIPSARAALKGVLSKKNGDTVHQLSAIGHAHIDTAWLWPLRETIRKCARTFSTAVDYMGRYPEYVFGCSQAQQYDWMKAYYPTIFAGIKEKVKKGQWEPIGSMWIEVDCNLASGESLIRQILLGKKFFREELGYETKDAWIPDVFGYSAALPQIYKGCEIDFFVTQKISWNQLNKFPHHTFLWEGIDGTRIFTHFPPADTYNGEMDPQSLVYNVNNFKEHGRSTRSLYVYGFGDGGGGPSITMLEQARRLKDFDGLPKLQPGKAIDFLKTASKEAKDLQVWVGELYLELHRGTYTTQARNKRGNRKSEFLLRDAEFFDALSKVLVPNRKETASDPKRAVYDVSGLNEKDSHRHARALDRAWKLVLLNQFHDIIPGSSIGWVYEDSARDYKTIEELGKSVLASSTKALLPKVDTSSFKKPVLVANTLGFARNEIVSLPDGTPTQVEIPASGYTVIEGDYSSAEIEKPVVLKKDSKGLLISNESLRIRVDKNGLLESVYDIEAKREVLSAGKKGNLFQLHPDTPNLWDAWDVDIFYKEKHTDLVDAKSVKVIEETPLRVKIRIERVFGKSKIIQDMIVYAGSRRVDFVTDVDWAEDHKLLKVAFPVDVLSAKATYEIQYGHLERPTHYNTSWDLARFEVCAQKWADLSEADYGVALLNDCKYGHDIFGNVMRISLLRAPTAPDPTADRGHHTFTYAFLPHSGDFRKGGVIEEAYKLNVPVILEKIEKHAGELPAEQSFFSVDRKGVIIESIKNAEDGSGVIVRFYEAYGTRGPATFSTALPVKEVYRASMIENNQEKLVVKNGSVALSLRPFEIVTLKLVLKK